jgi:hypothetical protein
MREAGQLREHLAVGTRQGMWVGAERFEVSDEATAVIACAEFKAESVPIAKISE